ncbi:hypothetical protein LZZ85_20440 [Terrimonas sp. NA20]|uniref:Outer membrane protein beta-barrel domain-containing protein n=1 Tax=Terrimonas ginsenosidimutans TaxID=2908004 RepID=A0ABS9KWE0_9BACT|nr:hypothetical protein [Terrimonas ginsenosidimutans]MCG2616679.1 hypothetical protein [Terrimonas ginsenosidimutans]
MKIAITILTLFIACITHGQQDSTVAIADSTEPAKSTLTIGVSYANNASYYGQKALEKTPYVAAVASYRHRSGLYATAMAYRLVKDSQTLASASSLGAGFAFNLSKHLSADLSYSHTFYPSLSPFLQAANANNASFGLTHTGWLTTSVGVDYAFGKTNDVFVTAGIGKMISLGSLGEKDLVTLNPSADVSAGTQRFFETYTEEKKLRDSILGVIPIPPIFGQPGNGGTTTTTKTTTSFDLLSYNLKIPLAYNRAHYMLELAYQLSLLSNKAQTGAGKTNSFLTASFYYQF